MSVLGGLLDKIRGKRQERFTSTAEQYDCCVHKLAAGQEVDLDHLAQLLDELDKSDSDLESDVSDKQRRIAARVELDRLTEISKVLPAKKQTVAKLQQELADLIAKKKPAIDALNGEIKTLQLESDRAVYVENELLTIGIPLALQQRQAAIKQRQRTLSEKQAEYSGRTESAIRSRDAARVRLADTESRLSKCTVPYDREIVAREAEQLRKRVETYSGQVAAWEPLRLEIEQEQSSIHEESQAIRRALMNP